MLWVGIFMCNDDINKYTSQKHQNKSLQKNAWNTGFFSEKKKTGPTNKKDDDEKTRCTPRGENRCQALNLGFGVQMSK